MSTVAPEVLTTEQLLAMPEDGLDRELIRGQLRERPTTKRNRFHTYAVTRLARLLDQWLDTQPAPLGEIHTGEVGTILQRDPDTTVGIDVAYFSADVMARQTDQTTLIEGPSVLAVEVLSPSDKIEDVREKVMEYIDSGVAMVWVVDPSFRDRPSSSSQRRSGDIQPRTLTLRRRRSPWTDNRRGRYLHAATSSVAVTSLRLEHRYSISARTMPGDMIQSSWRGFAEKDFRPRELTPSAATPKRTR